MRRLFLMLAGLVMTAFICVAFQATAEGASFAYVNKAKAAVMESASSDQIACTLDKYAVVRIDSRYNDSWYAVTTASQQLCSGYIEKAYLSIIESQEIHAYTKATAQMYTQPSASAPYILLSAGRNVRVIAVNGSWAMAYDKSGNAGYIRTSALAKGDSASDDEPVSILSAKVNTKTLQCYTMASTSADKAGVLSNGDIVRVISYDKNWAHISYDVNGTSFGCYCRKSYLKQVSAVPSATPEPTVTATVQPLESCAPFLAEPISGKVSVYAEPSTASRYLGSVSVGTKVTVNAYNSEWAFISLNGKTGYALISGLTVSAQNTPAPTAAPTASPATAGFSATPKSAKVPVYASASVKSKYLGYVSPGTVVNVISYGSVWAYIELRGNYGYTKVAGLKKVADSTVTPAPTGTVSPLTSCEPFNAVPSVSRTAVYEGPSASSRLLGYVNEGTQVSVLAYNSEWAYITLNNRYGYALTAELKKYNAPLEEVLDPVTPFTAQATASKVSVYSGTTGEAEYLGYISAGTEVTVHACGSEWAYISMNGRYGYVRIENLKRVEATATPSPTPTATPAPTATAAPSPTPTQEIASITTPTPTPRVYPESTDPIFTDTKTTNQQKAFLFLSTDTDYNQAVACGLVSNFVSESSCNPKSVNKYGYRGICQWSVSRWAILEKWCNQNDLDPDSLEGQLKFLRYDLSKRYTVYHKYLLTVENTQQGAYDAGYYFCMKYERPGNTEAASVKRGNNAKDTYWPKFVGV